MMHDHSSAALQTLMKRNDLFDFVGYAPCNENSENPCVNPDLECFQTAPKLTLDEIFQIPDLEAVVIETEDCELTKYAIMAAERGLAIQMDKPGSQSAEEFNRLISIVKEKNLPFQTGYMYRHNPAIREAIQKAKSGELGEIYAVEAHMDCEHKNDKREWLGKYKGGMMAFLGCHLVDLIYQIQGEPEEIIPYNTCTQPEIIHGAEDYGMAVFRYQNGVSFAKTCGKEPGGFMRRQLVICGTEGTIEINPLEYYKDGGLICSDTVETKSIPGGGWQNPRTVVSSVPQDRYEAMFAFFAAMVRGEVTNPYTPDYEQKLHHVFLKACGM